jgi:Predicted UDP-glucose 6-dehydrogenase
LIEAGLAAGNLRFTTNIEEAVRNIDILWVSYDTPVDDDDNADVAFVLAQIEQVLPSLASGVMVLISSQMPVGSIRHLEQIAQAKYPGARLSFACSPETFDSEKRSRSSRIPTVSSSAFGPGRIRRSWIDCCGRSRSTSSGCRSNRRR